MTPLIFMYNFLGPFCRDVNPQLVACGHPSICMTLVKVFMERRSASLQAVTRYMVIGVECVFFPSKGFS